MRDLKTILQVISVGLLSLVATIAYAQIPDTSNILDWERGTFPKEKESELYQIKVNGYYRFFATHLAMPDPYILDQNSGAVTKKNTLFIGDDTQLPNLMLNVNGRPSKKVSWGFDLYMFQFLDGQINSAYNPAVPTSNRPPVWDPLSGGRLGGNMGLNLGLNLYLSLIHI